MRALRPAAQQVVSIARALSRDIRLLIMDEPSAILDDDEVETLFGVVRRLKDEGVGVIYISHRLDEIPRIGDRVTVLSDGRTVATGLPGRHAAGRARRAHGRPQGRPALPRARAAATGDVLLSVRGVSGAPMVKETSFEVRAGEVVGIGGLVGAGRTELLRLIYGLDTPDDRRGPRRRRAGCRPASPAAAIAAGLGLAPEDRKSQGLLLDWSLTKNVTLADLGRFRRGPLLDGRGERKARPAISCARSTPCPTTRDRIVRELSGGNQQKVVLARWLLRQCKVLLLDEPTRGVDVGAKAEIYKVIADLATRGPRRRGRVLGAVRAGRALHPGARHARGRAGRRGRRRARRPSSSSCATPCTHRHGTRPGGEEI